MNRLLQHLRLILLLATAPMLAVPVGSWHSHDHHHQETPDQPSDETPAEDDDCSVCRVASQPAAEVEHHHELAALPPAAALMPPTHLTNFLEPDRSSSPRGPPQSA